ncbi:MAG: restriction endonuclease subunit S [Cyclobacteriaceae bacterium]|jgi:type I restriction enzyme S subunit|nr:restriction endonuclease subunit S [Flammeovirgaceae bacterium]
MSKVPKLRFKEFSGGWELKKLSQLLEFKNGINASKEQYGSGFKFINVLDILNNDFITHDLIIGSVDVDESVFEKYSVNYGDILFQRSSETREEVGTACVYLDSKPATFGGFVIRGKKIGEYDPMFLNKLLKTDLSRNEITSKSGGSTRYNVGQETLSSVALPFPSLPEQQKIASFLSAVDEKIQQLTRKKEWLEQYKKGVMQQLFSGKLRFKDENGKPYPKWEEKRLGEIGEIVSGLTYSPDDVNENGVLVLRSSNVQGRRIVFDDNVYVNVNQGDFNPVQEDDILICVRNGSRDLIGKNAIINKESDGLAFGAFMTVFRSKYSKYLFHFFDTDSYKKAVHRNLGATINSINGSDLKKFKVPFPSPEEQQKIASFLTALDAKIESVATQIAHTQTFKKGLLQQMFV